MRRAQVRIYTYGTAPKYGKRVYKVGPSGAPFLLESGWQHIHTTNHYIYLRAPEGVNGARPVVELLIPDRAEIEALSLERHTARIPWAGQLGRWLADYTPRREGRISSDLTAYPARLAIGVLTVWHAVVTWRDGDDAPPHWHEGRDQILFYDTRLSRMSQCS